MGWKDIFGRKNKEQAPEPPAASESGPGPDFSDVDQGLAQAMVKEGKLAPLYLMPLRFGGDPSVESNAVFTPPFAVVLKDRCDDMVEDLLRQEKVNGYECRPEYQGKSVVPVKITVIAKLDGKPVFTESIRIWGKEEA